MCITPADLTEMGALSAKSMFVKSHKSNQMFSVIWFMSLLFPPSDRTGCLLGLCLDIISQLVPLFLFCRLGSVFCGSLESNPFLKQLLAPIIPINLGAFNPSTLHFYTSVYWASEALACLVFSPSELLLSCCASLSYKHIHFSYYYCDVIRSCVWFIIPKLYWLNCMIAVCTIRELLIWLNRTNSVIQHSNPNIKY